MNIGIPVLSQRFAEIRELRRGVMPEQRRHAERKFLVEKRADEKCLADPSPAVYGDKLRFIGTERVKELVLLALPSHQLVRFFMSCRHMKASLRVAPCAVSAH
jgi:hypothetical protein